jgi:energy-coupling factor transport system permease protein
MEWGLLVLFVIWIGRLGAYLKWLRLVVPMALFFGAVTWWSADLISGFKAALNLLILVSVFFVFFNLTSPEDLGNALIKTGLPHRVAFVFSTSMQFVPIIARKAGNVLDAQRARGIPLEAGWKAMRLYLALLGPLLIQSFQLAEELAEAMEARGFGRSGRTFLKDYRLKAVDWLAIGGGGVLMVVWFWI